MVSSLFAVCEILMVATAVFNTVKACPEEKKNENKFQYSEDDPDNNCTLKIPTRNIDGFVIIFRVSQKRNNDSTTGFCFKLPSAAGILQLCPLKSESSFIYMHRFDGCDPKKLEQTVESKTENYNISSVVFADSLRRKVNLRVVRNGGISLNLFYESISCPRKIADAATTMLIVLVVLFAILPLVVISLIIWMKRRWNRNSRNDKTLLTGETGGASVVVGRSAFSRLSQDIPPPPPRRSPDETYAEIEAKPDKRRGPFSQDDETGSGLPDRPTSHAYADIEIRQKESHSPMQSSSVRLDKRPIEDDSDLPAFMAHESPENNITFSAESDQEDEEPYSHLAWDPPNTQRFSKRGKRTSTSDEDSADDMVKVNDDKSDCVTQDTTSLEERPTKVPPIDTARHNSENNAILVELNSSEEIMPTMINEHREESEEHMNDTYLKSLDKSEVQALSTSVEEDQENQNEKSGSLGSAVSHASTHPTPARSMLETIAAVGEDIDQLVSHKVEDLKSDNEQYEESGPRDSAESHVLTLPTPSRSILEAIAAVGKDFNQIDSHKVEDQVSVDKQSQKTGALGSAVSKAPNDHSPQNLMRDSYAAVTKTKKHEAL